jgi:hypothetical protein
MKTSAILKQTKKYLAKNYLQTKDGCNNKERYICFAITDLLCSSTDNILFDECIDVRTMIRNRLAGCASLEAWLKEKHGIKQPSGSDTLKADIEYINKVQATRHAWIDSMIAEFKAQGD